MNLDASVTRAKLQLNEEDFDFYRCYKCHRLITRVDEILFFTPNSKTAGEVCKCGSKKYTPTNPKWWEYFLPRTIRFAYYRIRGVA
jgi:hypothetical protein